MPKISKQERARAFQLQMLEKAGHICFLEQQPSFLLRGINGKAIATFTPDFKYKLKKELYGYKPGTLIVEEYKGSEDQWSYKRSNYHIFVRWLIADNPHIEFIENIRGKVQKPRIRYPKEKK